MALSVTALGDDAPFAGVVLHVDDEGDGISPDIRSRVFTKFWKHGARGGSGLGMYIVHGLVRAHGGPVEIGDAPAGGARITILWPPPTPLSDRPTLRQARAVTDGSRPRVARTSPEQATVRRRGTS